MDHDVQERVIAVMCDVLNRQQNEIPLDASLRDKLQLDSLHLMSLFIALEDEFQRTIPPEQVTELDSVRDIVEFIHRKMRESSSA